MAQKQQIPGYKLIDRLGSGGQANVYKGLQLSMNRLVAIKVIPPTKDADPTELARFLREARVLAKLRHDNIVQAIDYGEVNNYRYTVMEFIEGRSVLEIIETEGAFPIPRAVEIVAQLSSALEHAAELGVIHRDIKPANIVITKTRRAVLVDFGLARPEETDLELTMTGTTVGTPHYMSPEQIRGIDTLDIRADLYALGATFFHMVTGRVPFPSNSKAEIMSAHLKEEIQLPEEYSPAIPAEVFAIIKKAMEKDRDKRYKTPRKMTRDLETVLRQFSDDQETMDSQAHLQTLSDERDKLVDYTRRLEKRLRQLEDKLTGGAPEAMESANLAVIEEVPESRGTSGMILVEAGIFTAGEEEGKNLDTPMRDVHLDDFWIDRVPVTNAEYAEFAQATGRAAPEHWKGPTPPREMETHPVVWVTWQDALEYAKWRGKRLPLPLEWQKAARGVDGRTWPWGNSAEIPRCNCEESGIGKTTPAGHFRSGASPSGCLDMAGNVAEWVHSRFTGGQGTQIIRAVCGGSWRDSIARSRCASRRGYQDGGKAPYVGFRCASDAETS